MSKRDTAAKEKEARQIVSEINILKDRISSLVELENYREAESDLLVWQDKLDSLLGLEVFKEDAKNIEREFYKITPIVKRYENLPSQEIINLSENTIGFSPLGFIEQDKKITLFGQNKLYNFNLTIRSGNFTLLPEIESRQISIIDISLDKSNTEEIYILTPGKIFRYSSEAISLLSANPVLASATAVKYYNESLYVLEEEKVWILDLKNPELKLWLKSAPLPNPRVFLSIALFMF